MPSMKGNSRAQILSREYGDVKTTVELPEALFRQVKATAAQQGLLMKEFIAEALEEKLRQPRGASTPKPWMAFAGCLARDPGMKDELVRIGKAVEEEFGEIDEEDWK
jgi:hypothetical protein